MAFLSETIEVGSLPQGSGSYDPLPAGWYLAAITMADLMNTKSGTGQYIKVRYDIIGPSHQGRVVFGNLNIRNQSAKAEEIGRQQLGELMRAIGLARLSDTDALVGHELSIKLDVRNDPQYGASNEVKAYKAAGTAGSPPAPVGSSPRVAPPERPHVPAAEVPALAAPPWARK